MKAYLFWYKSNEYARTEYIYIIAVSVRQAQWYWVHKGYTRMYDYCFYPIDEIEAKDFMQSHNIGDILGQFAII